MNPEGMPESAKIICLSGLGMIAGLLAKHAPLIRAGLWPSRSAIIADLLLTPLIMLLSYAIVVQFGLSETWTALTTAGFAIAGDRVATIIRQRALRFLFAALPMEPEATPNAVIRTMVKPTASDPRAQGVAELARKLPIPVEDPDMAALLRALDDMETPE